MAITTSIPTTIRTPGPYIEFEVSLAQRGLVPLQRILALVGNKTAAGTRPTGVPTRVFTENEADTYWGKTSELALLCRAAFRAGRRMGNLPELWCVAAPVATGAGVAAATRTLTVTGPASAPGEVVFRIAGRTIRAGVAANDTANAVAASMHAAASELAARGELPGTVSVAAAVVTFTYAHPGVNGDDVRVTVDSLPLGVTVAVALTAGVGSYSLTTSLDALTDRHYNAVAVANHRSADITALGLYEDARAAAGTKKWAFGFVGENGTLTAATSLATAANREYTLVLSYEDSPSLPGEIAATIAAARLAKQDPALSFSGTEVDLYPPPAASVYTPGPSGEVEAALAAGVTPLLPNETQTASKVVRLVTTRTTLNGAPFEPLRDFGVIYTLTYTGEQVGARIAVWQSRDENRKNSASARRRLRSEVLDVLRQLEALEILQNVDAHKKELQAETDAQVKQRVNLDVPASVVPGLEQVPAVLRLVLE